MVPKHLGIIPDGNRRWARAQRLPTLVGHERGIKAFKQIARHAFDLGIETVTFYAFSTENWNRDEAEVTYLMKLFKSTLVSEMEELFERGVRFKILGRKDRLDPALSKLFAETEARTAGHTKGTIAFCLNYTGKEELADAAASLIRDGVPADEVTPQRLAAALYAPELPPLDLIIRTSGEHRLSGFMLARSAYAEYYFAEKNWPEFAPADLDAALEDYARRNRRFGA